MMRKGIDKIEDYDKILKNKGLGLITSMAAVNTALVPSLEIIRHRYKLKALFAPEHGIKGDVEAGQYTDSYIDPQTGIRVYSLYRRESKSLSPEMLDQIDILLYDIPDIGVRYYTYISTMIMALEECSKHNKPLIILDRPNPLGGDVIEGNVLDMAYTSFVGAYPLPVRYGLTIGELALMVNQERKLACDLRVIPCQGWNRSQVFDQTNQVWLMPSPNMPSPLTAHLYIGTCLFEGTILSEGRGTTYPFGLIGAPFVDGQALEGRMRDQNLPGLAVTRAYFKPTTSKFKDQFCQGIQLHITDPRAFESFRTGLSLLECIKDMYPDKNLVLANPENPEKAFISLLAGTDILTGANWSTQAFLDQGQAGLEDFKARKSQFHIYR